MLCAAGMGGQLGGEWIHVYVWLSPYHIIVYRLYSNTKLQVVFVFVCFFFLKNVGENCATGRGKSKEKGSEMPMSLACSGNNEKSPVWLEPHGGHRKKKEGR